ncbi:MAG: heme exporter protein CcmD [Acidiferrobacterales bacterium]|jgi:heme exporter protein CcmD
MNWSDFIVMGGYGHYVWSAYGFTTVVLALNIVIPLRRRHSVMRTLRRLSRAEAGQAE